MSNFISRLFNLSNRATAALEKKVEPIEELADYMASLSDEQLKENTIKFKERLANGETLDDILPEAYATVREAAKRVIGEFAYKVQLMGGVVLHQGDIAEMKTGEGKTLTSIFPVYLNALTGEGVHVVTVNEYLAERDSQWMGQIHRFLGLTVGLNRHGLNQSQKKAAYACDITYTTNSELGFDYLRDNMVTKVEDRVLRGLNMALVDEVDSILIDESRTPLIISGGKKDTANLYIQADRFVKRLTEDEDYTIDIQSKSIMLTEEGVERAESYFKIENLYQPEHTALVHHINQALKANYTMSNEVEYLVRDRQVHIVDEFTGRIMEGRVFSDGLHQAIEAKENVPIKRETSTLATITYQNFFRLYNKLCGMTGTAKTEEEEFLSIYNMRVFEIPTNRDIIREDYPDAVYGTKKAKYEALTQEVMERNANGQPILVGTISVDVSEFLSKMFKQRRIKHEVLNAKNHKREADIIAKAGLRGSVTIATNMAGRGTDIKLGPGVRELGGLAVLGSERHESRRIDNQLRGRSGRQGDPGCSKFFVSLEDELMVRFGSERISGMFDQLGDIPIESKVVTRAIESAQKRVEGMNFDIRKTLLEYDDVLRQQRETMYSQRDEILENDDVHAIIEAMFERFADDLTDKYTDFSQRNPIVNNEALAAAIDKMSGTKTKVFDVLSSLKDVEDIKKASFDALWESYENKIEEIRDEMIKLEKVIVLKIIDAKWIDHIDLMSKLRDGIHLRSYAQDNPLKAYTQEGYEMFETMMDNISREVVNFCVSCRIEYGRRKR
ncbi:MAG: preprotein translocase subunit SecA [Bacillota bacterium]|jgi:preprotein translocase subunit SecA|nr:preprotein translocase subunit SecA [Bacillota bacterium]NLL27139.1 preprotein translocase subunit SecA [Erysipelotrichia bacterium]